MKRLIFIICCLLFLIRINSFAEVKVVISPGIGQYSMSGMSDYNKFIRSSLKFHPKQLSDFPPYWNISAGLQVKPNEMNYGGGINYSFESTGSKMSIADYSGEYYNTFNINANSIGISLLHNIKKFEKFPTNIEFQIGYRITDLRSDEYIKIYEEDSLSTMTADAESFYFEAGMAINYPVSIFELGLKLSYLIDFGGEYKITSVNGGNQYNGYPLVLPFNLAEPIQTQWTGFRLRLFLGINLSQLLKK